MTSGAPKPYLRFALIAVAGLSLLLGMDFGLVRLGWALPPSSGLISIHGPLMVCGFLGTLIPLERAVALGRGWAYASPALAALGTLMLIAHPASHAGPLAIVAASAAMVLIFVAILRMQCTSFAFCMMLGAAAWLVGNVLWLLAWPIPALVPWWIAFLLLTIAGERLELSRLVKLNRFRVTLFWMAVALFAVGAVMATVGGAAQAGLLARLAGLGARVLGSGMLAIGVWMLFFDIARRTVRQHGLTRYAAASLLAGHVWLIISGALWLTNGPSLGGPSYDAMLHSFFLGFVFSMIFAHALIILPAVLGLSMEFSPWLYAPLVLLHASLVLRISGDVLFLQPVREWGGMLNVLAILLFLISIPISCLRARRPAGVTG